MPAYAKPSRPPASQGFVAHDSSLPRSHEIAPPGHPDLRRLSKNGGQHHNVGGLLTFAL